MSDNTNRDRAAEHAQQAETLLADAGKKLQDQWKGSAAAAHAALALYYQREADRG
jgi:hypothetical protein